MTTRSINDRLISNTSFLNQTDTFTDQKRKSLDFLEKSNQLIFLKNQTIYRALKKPILPFKEGLYFIHKFHSRKTSSKDSKIPQTKSYTRSPKHSLVPKLNQSFKIPLNSFSFTQELRSVTPVVKKTEIQPSVMKVRKASVVTKPVSPKIVIKRKQKSRSVKSSMTGSYSRDPDELNPWDHESISQLN